MATMLFAAFIGMTLGAFIALFTCDECYDETIVNWNGQC